MHAWLVFQLKTFYSEVIKQIVRWWTKCILKQGDCVEKLCSCKISALVFINMKHTGQIIIDSPSYFQIVTWLAPELRRQQCYCSFKVVNSSVVTTVVDMTGHKYLYVSECRLSLQIELQLTSHCLSNSTTTSTTRQSTSCDNLQNQPHPSPDLT